MEKLLSQDEVDALLKGISDGEVETENRPAHVDSGIRTYDFANQDRIIRGRMPTMEIINERFARDSTASLFRYLGRMAEVTVESFELIKFGEFLKKLPVPSSLNLFRTEPFRGSSLFFFDAKLIFLIVDVLFGGPGRSRMKIEGRNFTAIEQRIIKRLLDICFEDMKKAWSLLEEMTFRYVRSELNPQFANIVTPTDIVLATVFQVELEWDRAFMGYCIPYSTVEPVKDRLYGRFQSEYAEIDETWRRRLSEHLMSMTLDVSVELGACEVPLRDVFTMKVGDILRLNIGPDEPLALKIQDAGRGLCRAGRRNGCYAVEILSLDTDARKEKRSGSANRQDAITRGAGLGLEGNILPERAAASAS
ncbi:MAG: flagellar motor switch protein FliM [bacterium]